ncbi:MAG: TolB family protein [Pseudonocardiaceae bacterium]
MTLPDLITVEDFFRPSERSGASISPDGTRIAFLAPWKNRLNVWVQHLDGPAEPRCVTADETRTVRRYEWTNDPRFLLYLQDDGGDQNWHVFRVDLDEAAALAVDLTPFPGAQVTALEMPATRPGKAIVTLNARNVAEFDLHELDIVTGELTTLVENPGGVIGWLYAGEGALFARALTDEGHIFVNPENLVAMIRAAERFLARHLGGTR